MSDISKIRKIAKEYLESIHGQTIYTAQSTLKVAWEEYKRRTEGFGHLNEEQKKEAIQRIINIIETQFKISLEMHEKVPSVSEDNQEVIEKDWVKMSLNTKYLCVSCWGGQDFETELNKDAEVLIGLIYEIVKGRY